MKKRVSIALATYNGERYLQPLLDSIASQTLLPDELVVSDDSSSDATLDIIQKFSNTAPFDVKIIRNNKQVGIIENFAIAFDHCDYELIAYCDQDDVWDSSKLEICADYFDKPDVKLVMHRSQVVDENLNSLGYCIPDKPGPIEVPFPSSADMSYGLGHQMLFDAETYRQFRWMFKVGFTSLDIPANNYDIQFPFIAGFNGTIISIPETLVKFRRHNTATSDAGLEGGASATMSGFLAKPSGFYQDKAEELEAVIETFQKHVFNRPNTDAEKLQQYTSFLGHRAQKYRLRDAVYSNRHLLNRLKACFKLLFSGAYRKKQGHGFGVKAFVIDLFISIFGLRNTQQVLRQTLNR